MATFQNQFSGSDVTLQRHLPVAWATKLLNADKTIYISESFRNLQFQNYKDFIITKIHWSILCLATEFPKHVCPSEKLVLICTYREVGKCKGPRSPQMLSSQYFCDFCLSACICFGSSDYKLPTAGIVCYQMYIHKWAVRPLRMGPWKAPQNCFGFFQATQLESLRELPETLHLKNSYPNNIWFFTLEKKMVYCSFSVKHSEVSVCWKYKGSTRNFPMFNWHH